MNVLVRMPNWVGDAVMATPALNNLLRHFRHAQFVLVGSRPVAAMFQEDRRFRAVVTDTSRSARFRLAGLHRLGRQLRQRYGPFDLGWSFVNSLSSRLLMRAGNAAKRVAKRHAWHDVLLTDAVPVAADLHEAERFNAVLNGYLGTDYQTGPTRLTVARPWPYRRPTAGINPGGAYGAARRWPPGRFAEAAAMLAADFDLVIFGGPNERSLASLIEAMLRAQGVENFANVAGCSMGELLARIAGLDLFITNNTGPMHIAGAFGVPTVALFGSTSAAQTAPWRHPAVRILQRDMPCIPCGKRTCPLGHHACMTEIQPREVVQAAHALRPFQRRLRAG